MKAVNVDPIEVIGRKLKGRVHCALEDYGVVVGFVLNVNKVSPTLCNREAIASQLPPGWNVFLHSCKPYDSTSYRFMAVVHRSEIPRSEFWGLAL